MQDADSWLAALPLGVALAVGVLIIAVVLVPTLLFFLTLQRVMNKVSAPNRPFAGGLIWLSLFPVVGPIWQMVYIVWLSSVVRKEFARVAQAEDGGMTWAIAMVIAVIACMIPFVNVIAGVALLVIWIVYWVKMAGYNRRMPVSPALIVTPNTIHGV